MEIYGSEKKIELPFVMGVLADLSGKPVEPLPGVDERKFLEIDIDNFDERMKAIAPRVAFSVPNTLTGEGHVMVDITFESMGDFSPAAVANKVDALKQLLDARTHLVKPNLQWEARFRLLRLAGHALVFVLFGWLASALVLSHANNRAYLADVAARTDALVVGLRKLATDQGSTNRMIEALDMAHALPAHSGLDLAAPSCAG